MSKFIAFTTVHCGPWIAGDEVFIDPTYVASVATYSGSGGKHTLLSLASGASYGIYGPPAEIRAAVEAATPSDTP